MFNNLVTTPNIRIAGRRLLAFCIDWLVLAVWAGIIFGITMAVYAGSPPRVAGPWHLQILSFTLMTLPFILYFTVSEASSIQATIGKRILGLCVIGTGKERAPFSRTLLRNVIKFVPWMLGHFVANQAAFSTKESVPGWVYIPFVLSFAGVVWWLGSIFLRGRSPYEVLSSTCVAVRKNLPGNSL